jgi:hypothetical protein
MKSFMKKFKRKYMNLFLIAVIVQLGVYLYLDQVLLVPATSFSQHVITEGSNQASDPDKISTDRLYYANIESSKVSFLNADNKVIEDVALQANDTVTYFTWVPDTHIALIGISNVGSKSTTVTLKPINLDTNSLPVEPKISGLTLDAKITDVVFSPQINVTYILISNKTSSLVYRTDANNTLTKVLTTTPGLNIACLQTVDTLLYDNGKNGVINARAYNGQVKAVSPKTGKYSLIGTDKYDNLYIGNLDKSGLISSVLKGTIKGGFRDYETLNSPIKPGSISVSFDGLLKVN